MAIEKVTASIGNESGEMLPDGSLYSGDVRAPAASGEYAVQVAAYDDSGNVAIANSGIVDVTRWSPPKVNWKPTDRFNYFDYNRIKNNLKWLHDKAIALYMKEFDIVDMGENIEDYRQYWQVKYFNAWEENLDIINKHIAIRDYGIKKTFYENGPFIQWDELNRIENAILTMRNILDMQQAGLKRLSFRLGTAKGVRT